MSEKSFRRFTLPEYISVLQSFAWKVQFSEIHVHHTWKPTIADYRSRSNKESLIQAMWRYHTGTRGWSDIAQHITIDPDGFIWEGRSLLLPPASSTGYNDSDNDGIHPFMFEMIGNFDVGQERLEGAQLATTLGIVASLQDIWSLPNHKIRFHREMQPSKTCPGSAINKLEFVNQVQELRRINTLKMLNLPKKSIPNSSFPTIQDKVNIQINGKSIANGYLIDGVSYAPIRAVTDALELKLDWNQATSTASITKGGG